MAYLIHTKPQQLQTEKVAKGHVDTIYGEAEKECICAQCQVRTERKWTLELERPG